MTNAFVAIDLGAESGRIVALLLDADASRYELHEAHRFSTASLQLPGGVHWDIGGIWREIVEGLVLVAGWAEEHGYSICSVGVDTWGVDWGLVDSSGELLGLPHAYRDPRNQAAFEVVTEQISTQEIYRITGVQIMPINSLYSLFAMNSHSPELLAAAEHLLFMPDLIHFFLSGKVTNESTIASTSQLIDIGTGLWSGKLLDVCDVSSDLFADPISPGTVIGNIRKKLGRQTGLSRDVKVVAPASHDTASAVAAIPADTKTSWCFISSGTWSLVGAELSSPCVSEAAAESMFTNEAGVAGSTRFLKNVTGLWLVQQCRRAFAARGQTYTYSELADIAGLAEPFRTLINPDHEPFSMPGKILDKISRFAEETQQPVPETSGDYLRCCLESLALAYHQTIERLEAVLERKFEVIHIVGGGGQNRLLNQLTADACGKPVVVGPIEATSIGNSLVQAMALGEISGLEELREVVRETSEPERFEPSDSDNQEQAYKFFESLPGRS